MDALIVCIGLFFIAFPIACILYAALSDGPRC